MFKKIQQKFRNRLSSGQRGFIGTILLSQVLAVSVGALFVQTQLAPETDSGVQAPVMAEAKSVDVEKLLVTPQDLLEEKDQTVLKSLELASQPTDEDPTIDVKNQFS